MQPFELCGSYKIRSLDASLNLSTLQPASQVRLECGQGNTRLLQAFSGDLRGIFAVDLKSRDFAQGRADLLLRHAIAELAGMHAEGGAAHQVFQQLVLQL